MSTQFEQRLKLLQNPSFESGLTGIQRGIEKECLRIQPDGRLARTPHPATLGSALTHPHITTDYSEALLEFITGVHTSIDDCLEELDSIHQFVYQQLAAQNELLWTSSMPCLLEGNDNIPLAQYGSSNVANMKTIYRRGLGHRYGRLMQTIAGIHYNFSLPDSFWEAYRALVPHATALCQDSKQPLQDFKTNQYFGLIRNFRRYNWLLVYLFGASPAVCKSFLNGRQHSLTELLPGTFGAPLGTSLRMGDLGYQSNAQENLLVSYNNLKAYADSLLSALTQPHPDYVAIGLIRDGHYQQLSTALLQIENEFYSSIRPKRVARSEETPLNALCDRGVEYIEVRCLDVNPFLPLGIDAEEIRFLDVFLLYCLLENSPPIEPAEHELCQQNLRAVVIEGRQPALQLHNQQGESILFTQWSQQLLADIGALADLMDRILDKDLYRRAVDAQRDKILDGNKTSSARIVNALQAQQQPYFFFALEQAKANALLSAQRPLPRQQLDHFIQLTHTSLQEQQKLETAVELPFGEFLADYFRQYGELKVPRACC